MARQKAMRLRGVYSFDDRDPRAPILARLNALGEQESALLDRLEDDDFAEWEEAEAELAEVTRETRAVLASIAPMVKGWWL